MPEQPATPLEPTNLRGQVAIVTGASSGIGAAIASHLVRQGTHVALFARRTDRLESLVQSLTAESDSGHYGETEIVGGDVREEQDVRMLIERTLARWGTLDILIANAGFGYRKSLVDGDPQRWKAMIDTNVYGLLLTLKYGGQPLIERRKGQVVVTSSVAGRVPTLGGSAYCGTKFAATAIADVFRQEVAPLGVRVTTIEPGVVISEFQQVAEYPPDIVANMLKGAQPLVPDDVAAAVVFALRQPANVGFSELVVRPSGQAFP